MNNQKRWQDLSRGQQTAVIVGGIVQLGLLGAALWDIRRRPAAEIRGDKKLWVALAFINYIGPISYFLFGRKRAFDGDSTATEPQQEMVDEYIDESFPASDPPSWTLGPSRDQ